MAAVNPKVKHVPAEGGLELIQVKCAGSNTWKKGEFGHYESGLADPCETGEIPAFIYAETNATSTTANDLHWVYMLVVGTQIEIFCKTDSVDALETAFTIQEDYDLYVASNIHYVDSNASATDCFRILKKASEYEEGMHAAADSPGKVLVEVKVVQA